MKLIKELTKKNLAEAEKLGIEFQFDCDSSDEDTDPDRYSEALRMAFEKAGYKDVEVDADDHNAHEYDDDDDDDYRPGNYGQYTLNVYVGFTEEHPITLKAFEKIVGSVNGNNFGFGNGCDNFEMTEIKK